MFEVLAPHVGTKQKIRIERIYPSNPRLNGYLLALSAELGLMHCFDDFEPDGYLLFRLADVTEVRSGDYERHWDRMLAAEGLVDGLNLTAEIDLSSMRLAIESIDRHFHRMIVECEMDNEDDEDFYIGKLVSCNESRLCFDSFDGFGHWDEDPTDIPLVEISLVQFETPYIQRFWKYIGVPPARDVV